MQTIYRYDAPNSDLIPIVMPLGAKILDVGLSDRVPAGLAVWAQVDPDAPTVGRVLVVVGTGHPLPPEAEQGKFVGTFRSGSGAFVWHVFDAGVARLTEADLDEMSHVG